MSVLSCHCSPCLEISRALLLARQTNRHTDEPDKGATLKEQHIKINRKQRKCDHVVCSKEVEPRAAGHCCVKVMCNVESVHTDIFKINR